MVITHFFSFMSSSSVVKKIEWKNINLLSCSTYSNSCIICLNLLSYSPDHSTSSLISVGSCNHAYHSKCINQWIYTKQTCPHCLKTWSLHKELSIICPPTPVSDSVPDSENCNPVNIPDANDTSNENDNDNDNDSNNSNDTYSLSLDIGDDLYENDDDINMIH